MVAYLDNDDTETHQGPTIGLRIGQYRIIDWLGAGGMGRVYLAADTRTNAKVALKAIGLDVYDRALLEKEISTLKSLNHKNVVRFIESFEENNIVYIVTEFVDGRPLSVLIKKGSLKTESIHRYAMQILDALEYIHEMGIIHSDLKPGNIMIDTDDNVKLIDFGLVRTASAEIAADIKNLRGTLHYMSPEQADRQPYDVRSDLFAFGIILYELYTSNKPFGGEYNEAVFYSICYEDPVPPEKLSQMVSPQMSAFILKLLEKNPADRPGSAHEARQVYDDACREKVDVSLSRKRLAILPFKFPEGDENSQRLAQGLDDDFYTSLQAIKDLDVISPITIDAHASELTDSVSIRKRLGADYYLRGSILRFEERVRINVSLLSSSRDAVVWSERFDAPMKNFFEIMDDIVGKVLEEMKMHFIPDYRPPIRENPIIYELYLKAKSYYMKFNKKDLEIARNLYNQVLNIDPDYARAYVGLAECHCYEYINNLDRSEANIAGAITWAERALELKPHLPEAYRSLGRIMQEKKEMEKAKAYFERAVIFKEDYYQAHRSLGWLAMENFKYDEALIWIRKALSINPYDIETILLKGHVHLDRKESTLAIDAFTQCVNMQHDYGRALFFAGMAFYQLGRIDEAIVRLERSLQLGGDINTPYLLGCYYLAQGDYSKAGTILRAASKLPEISFLAEFNLGVLELALNRPDLANRQFRIALQQCRELLDADTSLLVAKAVLCKSLALLGERENCEEYIVELRHAAIVDGSITHDLAHIFAILGDREITEKYMTQAVDTVRGPTRRELENDPLLNYFYTKALSH